MKARWYCGRCGAAGLTRIETRQVWHRCNKPRREYPPLDPWAGTTREEVRQAVFFAAVEALGGDPALWRPLEENR